MLRRAIGEREPHAVPGADREGADELVLGILCELMLAPHEHRIVPADHAVQPVSVAPDPRPDLAVVEPGRDSHLELDRAADPFDHAQDLTPVGAERAVTHDEAVEQPRLARRADELGLEHERVVEI